MDSQMLKEAFNGSSSSSSDGLWNSNYGSYQNFSSNDSFGTHFSSPTNSWNSNDTVSYGITSTVATVNNLTDQFTFVNLVNKAHDEVQQDIQKGIKADYYKCKCKVCKWLQNPSASEKSSSRGRPESEKEYEKQNIWRNNWIYRQKKSMEDEMKKAKQTEIFQKNESLNDQYFNLCLEYVSLKENLCPHNRTTLENIQQNANYGNQNVCVCPENCQNGRF